MTEPAPGTGPTSDAGTAPGKAPGTGPSSGTGAAFDVVVVGAGPAGSAAALEAARAGMSVALLERGPYPGAKNVYGGVVYGRVLDELVPRWWETMPVQRWVTRRSTMMLTPQQALTVDFRSENWGRSPYNGATAHRAELDGWLASLAQEAGAVLVTSTTATGLLRDSRGAVVGVRTDRPDGDLRARVVIACDGVNSFLAREAGLFRDVPGKAADHTSLGVKETLSLPRELIEERFGVHGRHGQDIEIVGCTKDIPGGGFLYTNLDSVSVGVVLSLTGLAASGTRPEEVLAGLKEHPAIAPLLKGAQLKEYSAHLIPEGGYDSMPALAGDGILVAGDAAAMCLAAGVWLEGINYALGAGMHAGRTAAAAVRAEDTSRAGLAGYRRALEDTFVLADHRRLRGAGRLVFSERVQRLYPQLACEVAEGFFTVDNPRPKPGLRRLLRTASRSRGLTLRHLLSDARAVWRSFA